MVIDRYWLITWVTYGTWLPGDERGFVSQIRDANGRRTIHNIPGTPRAANIPALQCYARSLLKSDPIRLSLHQAETLLEQFQETSYYRDWLLLAVGIVANHVHTALGVPADPEPEKILGDLKSYGSRKLNRRWGKPESETSWARSGSTRKLPNQDAVLGAIRYVIDQEYPLLVWTAPVPELDLAGVIIGSS
jgi:REP element-mobilizing transposase RayT